MEFKRYLKKILWLDHFNPNLQHYKIRDGKDAIQKREVDQKH